MGVSTPAMNAVDEIINLIEQLDKLIDELRRQAEEDESDEV